MASAVLETQGLIRTYGKHAVLSGVDLKVEAGQIYGFLGRNGAGKTTTIRILMGIMQADSGTVSILGETRRRPSTAQKRHIGYVAQEQNFYPWMTCAQLAAFVRPFYPSWDDAESARLFSIFSLPPDRKVSQLSQGMKVKLALALALAPRPPLLILDEPTAGLDPVARREFLELIHHHARTTHRTVFFSSHLVDEVERVADQVGILEAGRLVYQGSLDTLRATVRRVPLGPVDQKLQVLRQDSEGVVCRAPPEVWDKIELSHQTLSLDDIFIALVGQATS